MITDYHMLVMDGYELAPRIRDVEDKKSSLNRSVIIGYTADTLQDGLARCPAAGMEEAGAGSSSLLA